MKPGVLTAAIAIAALSAIVGCDKETEVEPVDRSTLRWEMRTVERATDSLAQGTRIVIEYPEIVQLQSESALDSINAHVLRDVLSDPTDSLASISAEQLADRFIGNYRGYRSDFPEDTIPWTEERRMAVASDTNGVLGLVFSLTSFTGGAHANAITEYSNYSIATGRRLKMDDLFVAGYRDELNKKAEPYFRAVRQILPSDDLAEAGFWFGDSAFAVNDNFLVGAKGITFTFNPYEVAPYALGPTTFTVPYSAIMNLIDPSGPLTRFVTR